MTASLSTASVHVHPLRALAQDVAPEDETPVEQARDEQARDEQARDEQPRDEQPREEEQPLREDAPVADAPAAHHVAPPPAPEEHGATLSVEVHGGAEIPLARDTICPANADCVLGLGLGVGAQIERRSSDRIGLFAAYDFWLLDSGGVYEIGSLHGIRGGLRYVLDDSLVVHPFLDVAVGLVVFGDTANVATVGGVVTGGGGAEIELSESVAFVTMAEAWLFATGPFRTRDGVTRAADFGVNVALQLTVGISVIVGPIVAPPARAR